MTARLCRLIFWAVPLVLLAAAIAWALRPQPVAVDMVEAARGPLEVSVAEEGRTRIRDVFEIAAPVSGRVRRSGLEAGDAVEAGEIVAEIEPADPAFLDARSFAEARADMERARAGLAFAEARLTEAKAELDFAAHEIDRVRELRERGAVSARALEEAQRLFLTREAALETAKAAVRMEESALDAAEVRLLGPAEAGARAVETAEGCACVPIPAPVSGRVLRVLQESERVVEAGQPLLEIGDPADLEVAADFLSADAVRIRPGMAARIEAWGGPPLAGTVTRVEPYGFTEVSALGIEEQRVGVEIAFDGPREDRAALGHGFQVEARVILARREDALKVPLTSLFRAGDGWAVFAVDAEGMARLRPLEIGARNAYEAEVAEGLSEGETVVRYPHDDVADGVLLERR